MCYLETFWCTIQTYRISDAGATASNAFGKGVGPAHNFRFYCSGSESGLFYCTYGYYTYSCYYSNHAGVKCEGKLTLEAFISCMYNFYSTLYQPEYSFER